MLDLGIALIPPDGEPVRTPRVIVSFVLFTLLRPVPEQLVSLLLSLGGVHGVRLARVEKDRGGVGRQLFVVLGNAEEGRVGDDPDGDFVGKGQVENVSCLGNRRMQGSMIVDNDRGRQGQEVADSLRNSIRERRIA